MILCLSVHIYPTDICVPCEESRADVFTISANCGRFSVHCLPTMQECESMLLFPTMCTIAIAFSTTSLWYIYVRSSLCWTPLHGWLSESGSSTALRRFCMTTFTGFLLTSESSSNYVCSYSNVNTRWHHHTWHRCVSSCRPTHVVVSYDQRLVMIFWSHVPGLLATVHVASHVRPDVLE